MAVLKRVKFDQNMDMEKSVLRRTTLPFLGLLPFILSCLSCPVGHHWKELCKILERSWHKRGRISPFSLYHSPTPSLPLAFWVQGFRCLNVGPVGSRCCQDWICCAGPFHRACGLRVWNLGHVLGTECASALGHREIIVGSVLMQTSHGGVGFETFAFSVWVWEWLCIIAIVDFGDNLMKNVVLWKFDFAV